MPLTVPVPVYPPGNDHSPPPSQSIVSIIAACDFAVRSASSMKPSSPGSSTAEIIYQGFALGFRRRRCQPYRGIDRGSSRAQIVIMTSLGLSASDDIVDAANRCR